MIDSRYPHNQVDWPIGSLVIHAEDGKRFDMLMVVVGRTAQGEYLTRYALPFFQPPKWLTKEWCNPRELLLDPQNFGITVPSPF
ncbi:hypothetical protein OL229_16120 [Neisseriaceae bacterium JH1-16]|nr:hypothetical protein [Neisseriaceae bacterium JH1-16]